MSSTLSPSLAESLADICRTLEAAHQQSLLEFAEFLKGKEAREAEAGLDPVDEEDEAKWGHLFREPAKVANLARSIKESIAREEPRPFDASDL